VRETHRPRKLEPASPVGKARDLAREDEPFAMKTPCAGAPAAPPRGLDDGTLTLTELSRGVLRRLDVGGTEDDLGGEAREKHACALPPVTAFELRDALKTRDDAKAVLASLGEAVEKTRDRPERVELVEDEPKASPGIGTLRKDGGDHEIDPRRDERTLERDRVLTKSEEEPPAARAHPGPATEVVRSRGGIERLEGRKVGAQDRAHRGGHALGSRSEETCGSRSREKASEIRVGGAEQDVEEASVRPLPSPPEDLEDSGEKPLGVVVPLLALPVPGGDESAGETCGIACLRHLRKGRPGNAPRVEGIEEAIVRSRKRGPTLSADVEDERPLTASAERVEETLDERALPAPGTPGHKEVVRFEPMGKPDAPHDERRSSSMRRSPGEDEGEGIERPTTKARAGGLGSAAGCEGTMPGKTTHHENDERGRDRDPASPDQPREEQGRHEFSKANERTPWVFGRRSKTEILQTRTRREGRALKARVSSILPRAVAVPDAGLPRAGRRLRERQTRIDAFLFPNASPSLAGGKA